MITCTRSLEFDAAHRVMNHESKCATLHGHRYKVEIHAHAKGLDKIGRVVDFSVLKEKIGGWIDHFWDHTSLVWDRDVEVVQALKKLPQAKPPFVTSWNPTAENMAEFLLKHLCPMVLQNTGVTVIKVVVWETPNCSACAVI